MNLTWAKRKHCRSSWLNSGRLEADCFSSALTDPATATCQCFSADVQQCPNTANEICTRYSIVMLWKMEKRLYLMIKVSCIVAIIQSKYDFIWISGSNLWTKQGNRGSLSWLRQREQKTAGIWTFMRPVYLFMSFENSLTMKEWKQHWAILWIALAHFSKLFQNSKSHV